ncbi:MAG: LapA family protein [Spirochaetales bacterium]|nr:LapA family protein [Spirochaetales bacterium]
MSRLIGFLIILIIFAVFTAFNLSNRSDVSIAFYTFKNVPIFLSLLVSFILGALFVLPFTLFKKKKAVLRRDAKKKKKELSAEGEKQIPEINGTVLQNESKDKE